MPTRGDLVNALSQAYETAGGDPRVIKADGKQASGGEASLWWEAVVDRALLELTPTTQAVGIEQVFETDEHGVVSLVVKPVP